ncbi:MAG TPA: hypothetical protein VGI72_08450 [Gaiellales bacterium]
MADPAPRSHVIADRYLTSPAALAAHPFGPVDALDTHSGRGAQVRIVFAGGEWDEAGLAEAVARWCGIGCSEVCGVLDFGRHGDRWFLVLPPSLGLPVERWRMLRRPTAEDAARLTLAFGRLAERVAAAGFSPDAAALADVAVGPGPTPFLERPLLQGGGGRAPVVRGDGQRVLAAVCAAALGSLEPPAGLREWAERAGAGAFPGLLECLDDLERRGIAIPGPDAGPGDEPPGLERLFDEQFDLDGPAISAPRERPRLGLAALPVAIIAILGVLILLGHGARSGAASPTPGTGARPPATTAVVGMPAVPSRTPRTPGRRPARHPHHRAHPRAVRTHRRVVARAAPTPTPPAAPATPPPGTTSTVGLPAGTVTLPPPGGTTLPAP